MCGPVGPRWVPGVLLPSCPPVTSSPRPSVTIPHRSQLLTGRARLGAGRWWMRSHHFTLRIQYRDELPRSVAWFPGGAVAVASTQGCRGRPPRDEFWLWGHVLLGRGSFCTEVVANHACIFLQCLLLFSQAEQGDCNTDIMNILNEEIVCAL